MVEALQLENVHYEMRGHILLTKVSHIFAAGCISVVVGPNGAGKTTLLKLASGLLSPTTGQISFLDNAGASDFADPQKRAQRIAYLPQFPTSAWPLAVRDVVGLGLLPEPAMPEDERLSRIDAVLKKCRVAQFASRSVTELSGGERAKVMLARLLVGSAQFLLLDEPVQSLDPAGAHAILDILQAEAQAGRGIVLVLHALNLARRYGDEAVLMRGGRVVATGAANAVFTPPQLQSIFDSEFESVGDYVFPTFKNGHANNGKANNEKME